MNTSSEKYLGAIAEESSVDFFRMWDKDPAFDVKIDGIPLINYAISFGAFDIAKQLLGRYAGRDLPKDDDGNRFLHMCSIVGAVDLSSEAVAHGMPINEGNHGGQSPLMLASKFGHEDMCRFLLRAGARVGDSDHDGLVALHYASMLDDYVNVGRLLIEAGADKNTNNSDGRSPIDYAQLLNRTGLIRLLESKSQGHPLFGG